MTHMNALSTTMETCHEASGGGEEGMKCEDCRFYSMWDGCCMNPLGDRTWLNVQGQEACELFEEDERL